jgi:N6-adenosine-specific RNA methylase IME4
MNVTEIPTDSIIVQERQRRPLGDIDGLVASISEIGLLHPIVVGSDFSLKVGFRRLVAFKRLGKSMVPAHVTDSLDDVFLALKAERDENVQRETLPPSLLVERARELHEEEERLAKERRLATLKQGKELPDKENFLIGEETGQTRDKVAAAFGLSGKTYEKARQVIDAAENEPGSFGDLSALMDETSVDRAHRELQKRKQAAMPKPAPPIGKYCVVYADPPWSYDNSGFDQSAAAQYPTMTTADIAALPIVDIAADDCVLFLWATSPLLPEALRVMAAWGFEYKASRVWVKDRAPGIGWFVRTRHEFLLIGVRGSMHPAEKLDSVIEAPVTRHSAKPEDVYGDIEHCYGGPRIELFARKTREGWESWGDEVNREDESGGENA